MKLYTLMRLKKDNISRNAIMVIKFTRNTIYKVARNTN